MIFLENIEPWIIFVTVQGEWLKFKFKISSWLLFKISVFICKQQSIHYYTNFTSVFEFYLILRSMADLLGRIRVRVRACISDIIGRWIEKVRNGHRFEKWLGFFKYPFLFMTYLHRLALSQFNVQWYHWCMPWP
jgi:hypothetical protein